MVYNARSASKFTTRSRRCFPSRQRKLLRNRTCLWWFMTLPHLCDPNIPSFLQGCGNIRLAQVLLFQSWINQQKNRYRFQEQCHGQCKQIADVFDCRGRNVPQHGNDSAPDVAARSSPHVESRRGLPEGPSSMIRDAASVSSPRPTSCTRLKTIANRGPEGRLIRSPNRGKSQKATRRRAAASRNS